MVRALLTADVFKAPQPIYIIFWHTSTAFRFLYLFLTTASLVVMATLWNSAGHYIFACGFFLSSIWPPYVIGQAIIFLPSGFFFVFLFFPCLISAVADWMSAILPHMV